MSAIRWDSHGEANLGSMVNGLGSSFVRRALGIAVLAALIGCASSEPPPRLFLLTPVPVDAAPPSPARNIAVGVSAVTVPEYLDRPEIVVRSPGTEVRTVESARWAERLTINASRVVVENLGIMLNSREVVFLPARYRPALKYEVGVDLMRFELQGENSAVLVARWTISQPDGTVLRSGQMTAAEPVNGSGAEASVAAMSRNLAKVSREIATMLGQLPS